MRIVVHHLTRMQQGFICLAGADLDTGWTVRPVLFRSQVSNSLLVRYGGPFDIGVKVDLGIVKPIGRPPEVEDHIFDPRRVRGLGTMAPHEFWRVLTAHARPKLRSIFGPALTARGRAATTEVGLGLVSLGSLTPTGWPRLYLQQRPGQPAKVRLAVGDGEFDLDLGVTDVRLFAADHLTPDAAKVQEVAQRLARPVEVVLSVGLSRPFSPSADVPRCHWLQVNNLHFVDDPLWALG